MFTGIVEATGQVVELAAGGTTRRLRVSTDLDVASLPKGGSIAVDGVCLTAVERGPGVFGADIGPETLAMTTLGERTPGDRVHLERPLRAGDPLGGHIVTGHVDGVGTVSARREIGDALELDVEIPAALARLLVAKGSITVDGVSLTVNTVRGTAFAVTLIPHTLAVTTLGQRRPGARVNLEADWLARQIDRLLDERLPALLARRDGPWRPDPDGSRPGAPRRPKADPVVRLPRKPPW